ncbi:MAG: hypothetical protein WD825_16095 [Gemmatimonadaceae bacterium]
MAGCRRQVVVTSAPGAPGAATAREAVQLFMASAKTQDLQAMANVWGSSAGPIRNTIPADEVEKRSIYIMRCLRHDTYSILGEVQIAGGERGFTVEVRRGNLTPRADFNTTQGPENRWFVRIFELEKLNPICASQ